MTRTEINKKIKEYVTILHNTFHPNDKPVYTDIIDWPYAVAINIINSCGDIETHSSKMLKIVNRSVICVDDEYVETPVKDLTKVEAYGLYIMLKQCCDELNVDSDSFWDNLN